MSLIEKGLEELLRQVNREIMIVESRLRDIALLLGLSDWRELEKVFRTRGIDNPELDMLWVEYVYLKEKLNYLYKYKKEILKKMEE